MSRCATALAGVAIAAVLCGSIKATQIGHSGLVVGEVRLNEAGWDILPDERHGRILFFDTLRPPSAASDGGLVLKILDPSSARVERTVPLRQTMFSPVLDVSTGQLLAFTTLDRARPFSVVSVSAATGITKYTTYLATPPSLPPDWLEQAYSVAGAGELGSVTVDDRSEFMIAISRRMYDINNHYYPDTGVFVVDLLTGALLHTIRVPGVPFSVALDPLTQRAFVTDGLHGALWLIDPMTGAFESTIFTHGIEGVTVDAMDQRALAVGVAGLYLLDARTGHTLRSIPGVFGLPLPIPAVRWRALVPSSVVASPGHTAVPGSLRLMDTLTGRVLWKSRLSGSPWYLSIDRKRDRVFAASCTSATPHKCTITVLGIASGNVQRTINVPALLYSMVVDVRTGYVIIATQGGPPMHASDPWAALRSRLPFHVPFLPTGIAPTPIPHDAMGGTITVLDVGG